MMKTQVNVNNMFILNADAAMLAQLADALVQAGEMNAKQRAKLVTLDVAKQRISIGTRYANSKQYSAAFSAGTLTLDVDAAEHAGFAGAAGVGDDGVRFNYEHDEAQNAHAEQASSKRASNVKSAKQWLRELLNADGASYTLKQLCALSGKSEVNIRTMLSDLRSAKYCGSAGVFNTKSTRVDGSWYYSKA